MLSGACRRGLLSRGQQRHAFPSFSQCRFKATAVEEEPAVSSEPPPRIVTAAALFDGHDAAINVMRRLIQAKSCEVIHLGHDRSAQDIVDTAIQEDAQAVALTSYQGGHMEYFMYIHDLLEEAGCGHIKIYGGGGGTISPPEIKELHERGIDRIYSPEDGRRMGLDGMIQELVDGAASVDVLSVVSRHGRKPVHLSYAVLVCGMRALFCAACGVGHEACHSNGPPRSGAAAYPLGESSW